MIKKCLSFQEALNKANDFGKHYSEYSDKNVLLANGFSIACCKEIFTYKTLFEGAKFSKEVNNVFQIFKTFDFEKIINKMIDTSKIIDIYDEKNSYAELLKNEAEKIKEELVNVISKKHPNHQHEITDSKYLSAYKFLSNFSNIYTLNYDMLLYWTIMLQERKRKLLELFELNEREYKDNFGRNHNTGELYWYKSNHKQNIFYLHGALHLFDNGSEIIKAETTDDENLMDIIRTQLNIEHYPLIVTEGTSEEKLNKISHNRYLQNAIEQLRYIKGSLFIHGHSLDDNDKHIINAINKNKNLKQIFISVYDPKNNFENIQQKAISLFIDNIQEPKDLFYYDADSAHVWDSISEEDINEKLGFITLEGGDDL